MTILLGLIAALWISYQKGFNDGKLAQRIEQSTEEELRKQFQAARRRAGFLALVFIALGGWVVVAPSVAPRFAEFLWWPLEPPPSPSPTPMPTRVLPPTLTPTFTPSRIDPTPSTTPPNTFIPSPITTPTSPPSPPPSTAAAVATQSPTVRPARGMVDIVETGSSPTPIKIELQDAGHGEDTLSGDVFDTPEAYQTFSAVTPTADEDEIQP